MRDFYLFRIISLLFTFVLQAYRKKQVEGVPSIKQVLPAEKTIGVRAFARTPFHTPCPARYSVLHLLGVLSGGIEPPFTQESL